MNNLSTLSAIYDSQTFRGHDGVTVPNTEYAYRVQHIVVCLGQDRDAWKQLAEQMYYLVKSEQEVKALELFVDAVLARKRLEVEAGL